MPTVGRLYSSLLVVCVVLATTGWSTFCPVTSPFEKLVYVTDNVSETKVGLTKTECALQCAFFVAHNDVNCRCFNYNSTSMNCSLFTFDPTHYDIDQSQATVAYQFRDNPIRGLWSTVPASNCAFPFSVNGVDYHECRHGGVTDEYCSTDYYSCYISNGQPAFCIPSPTSTGLSTSMPATVILTTAQPWTTIAESTTTLLSTSIPETTSTCIDNGLIPFVDAANCSYPFTYNSVLFYNCTNNMTGVTNYCVPFACLTANKTDAKCYPPADFVAQSITMTVSISGQPDVSTLSVFGWIVIMTRNGTDGNWALPWNSYKNGFTVSDTDFWLGLERVHQLTSTANYRLRIEMFVPFKKKGWVSVEYWSFLIDTETAGYKLGIAGWSGDIADNLQVSSLNQNGMKFSTVDADSDAYINGQCVQDWGGGGWWFNNCGASCLTCNAAYTYWSQNNKVQQSRMMIKPQTGGAA